MYCMQPMYARLPQEYAATYVFMYSSKTACL